MHFICTHMWTKFYSCKKWVLHHTLTPALPPAAGAPRGHRRSPKPHPTPMTSYAPLLAAASPSLECTGEPRSAMYCPVHPPCSREDDAVAAASGPGQVVLAAPPGAPTGTVTTPGSRTRRVAPGRSVGPR
jgi:hypothetical protein